MWFSTFHIKVTGTRRPLSAVEMESIIRRGLIEQSYDWRSVTAQPMENGLDDEGGRR